MPSSHESMNTSYTKGEQDMIDQKQDQDSGKDQELGLEHSIFHEAVGSDT